MKEQCGNAVDEANERVMKLKKENLNSFEQIKSKIEEIRTSSLQA